MANTIEIVIKATDAATRPLRNIANDVDQFGRRLQSVGDRVAGIGIGLTAFSAPLVLGLRNVATQYMEFDRALTNAAAVLGNTRDEMGGIRQEILDLAATSLAGPQAAVEAYYDIVSGVADATTHMAILEASMHASEAGAASLGGTTSAMISIMNAYGFAADKASFASDVLTRTVGMGVGSMNDFASALPNVTSLAAQLGVGFENVGAMSAYLTTKGYTAAESTTSLTQSMIALLRPNEAMKTALAAIGAESGSAAIEQYGLAGTFQRLNRVMNGSTDRMVEAVGSVEAMRAVLALTGDEFNTFSETFINGVDGATEAARAIQLDSLAADVDLLRSEMGVLNQEIGQVLEPYLRQAAQAVRDIIGDVRDFVRENPEMVEMVASLAAAAAVAGPALIGIGGAIKVIGIAVAAVTSPIAAVAAVIAGLAYAYETNFAGIRDTVQRIIPQIEQWLGGLVDTLRTTFEEGIPQVMETLGGIWTGLQEKLQPLADWFTDELAPALGDTFDKHIKPFVEDVLSDLGQMGADLWEDISPELQKLFDWFMTTGLPAIGDFITKTAIPSFNKIIDWFRTLWDFVSPFVKDFLIGTIDTGLNVLIKFIEGDFDGAIDTFLGFFNGLWELVRPHVETLRDGILAVFDWIKVNVIDPFNATIESIGTAIQNVIDEIRRALGMQTELAWSDGSAVTSPNQMPPGVGSGKPVGRPGGFIPPEVRRDGGGSAGLGGDSYVIQVAMPAGALASPAAAQQAGDIFGQQIALRLRERG